MVAPIQTGKRTQTKLNRSKPWITASSKPFAEIDGIMVAIPLNLRGHPQPTIRARWVPLCPQGLEMMPSYEYDHPKGYRAQILRCPKLFPTKAAQFYNRKQFAKGGGCVKHINV